MLRDVSYKDASPTSFRDGGEFEEFARDLMFERLGWWTDVYRSKHFQFGVGESRQGVEFKLDSRCTETGRLSIEVAEKANADSDVWVPSGIMRDDNTILYVQGNSEKVWIFSKKFLRQLFYARGPAVSEYGLVPSRPTVRRFFMPISDADKYSIKVLTCAPPVAPKDDIPF